MKESSAKSTKIKGKNGISRGTTIKEQFNKLDKED